MRYKLLTHAIVSAIHPNEPQMNGTIWDASDKSDALEAEALARVGLAKETNEAATVKTIAERNAKGGKAKDDTEDQLTKLIAGKAADVEAALPSLSIEQLHELQQLEAAGHARKGVTAAITAQIESKTFDAPLLTLLEGTVEQIEAGLEELTAEQLVRLSELEVEGQNRVGVADAIAQYDLG
jgi:hypothetical protein